MSIWLVCISAKIEARSSCIVSTPDSGKDRLLHGLGTSKERPKLRNLGL